MQVVVWSAEGSISRKMGVLVGAEQERGGKGSSSSTSIVVVVARKFQNKNNLFD